MNTLHNLMTTVHPDHAPQLLPATWLGDCFKNGTSSEPRSFLVTNLLTAVVSILTTEHAAEQDWTQPKIASFLDFLGTEGITCIGVWCLTDGKGPIGFPCPGTGEGEPYAWQA